MKTSRSILRFAVFALALTVCSKSFGHFLWLKITPAKDGHQAQLFFSEAADLEGDKLPSKVADASVFHLDEKGKRTPLKLELAANDKPLKTCTLPATECRSVSTTCTYGNYHGTLLTYYSKAIHTVDPGNLAKVAKDKDQLLDIIPSFSDGSYQLKVTWKGQPVADAELTVTDSEGEETTLYADKQGLAKFTAKNSGIHGVLSHHEDKAAKGKYDDQAYNGAHHYATLTVPMVATKSQSSETIAEGYPKLPLGIASFGAAVVGDHAYIYGGHTGTAHDHSRENLSDGFYRLNLKSGKSWEKLRSGPALQGLALAAHGKYLYRVGGLDAHNAAGEEENLHSVKSAARFNTRSMKWETLPDMPFARSSHDAFVMQDKLYVVGGWALSGDSEGKWQNQPLVMDLKAKTLEWQILPEAPFYKRALAIAVHGDHLFAMCGMDSENDVSRTVYQFDSKTKQWKEGPELDGSGMDGFGISACTLDGRLYQSGHDGTIYQLAKNGKAWKEVGELRSGRFFHRLVAYKDKLVAIGGASHTGHLTSVEEFSPSVETAIKQLELVK
jgi:N-acetylneuraminic acid mutarotase